MAEKEYVERETLLDRIRGTGYAEPIKSNLLVMAVTIPAADVRPVVMCKDCMHWEYDAIFADGWCRRRQQGNPNWYCADGENKEES